MKLSDYSTPRTAEACGVECHDGVFVRDPNGWYVEVHVCEQIEREAAALMEIAMAYRHAETLANPGTHQIRTTTDRAFDQLLTELQKQ